jgi:pyridoxal phosphate enzyme (YggS family)
VTALDDVRARIAAAASAAGRAPDDVRLVAVSKEHPVADVEAVYDQGQQDFGENRAQDLVAKAQALPGPRWHFIGRLQRNKVRALVPFVARWHSVDRDELATELARHGVTAPVLVQVNLAGEPQKGGCAPDDAPALVEHCRVIGLHVDGLMTVPPAGDDPRPHFARLRELAGRLQLRELSMGMTGDFESAIAEGATIVRIGSAIFGPRVHGTQQ